jgi:hypothetical protein
MQLMRAHKRNRITTKNCGYFSLFLWVLFLLFRNGVTPLQTVGGTNYRKDLKRTEGSVIAKALLKMVNATHPAAIKALPRSTARTGRNSRVLAM